MSVQVERLEKNMAKLTIEVSAEDFEKALQAAYQKEKGRITLPGFRKGKAPRKMIEKMYGKGVFYETAANDILPGAYSEAADESGLEITSNPDIDFVQIEAGKPFIFTATVAVKPEVTLGEYKGIEIEKIDVTVTDEDVAAEIEKEQKKNARTVNVDDRAVENGDMIKLDFEGFVDGVAFEGGKGEDSDLTIGSNTFIPGFEEQLIGAKIGEEMEVNVTFPEDYHAEDLKGKAAVFKCTVKAISYEELPELDDEFAQEVSEFDTLEEYKADLKKTLEERKVSAAKTEKEDAAVEKAVENAQMDIPAPMLEAQTEQMINDYARRLQAQGLALDMYLQYSGQSMDDLKEQVRPQAEKQIRTRLVLEKIAEVEDIQISDEKVDEEIAKMAEQYKIEADKLKEMMGDAEKEQIKKDLAVQEAITMLAEEAKEV